MDASVSGELDLDIENMNSPEAEARVGELLRGLAGVHSVRLVQGGAFVTYRVRCSARRQRWPFVFPTWHTN